MKPKILKLITIKKLIILLLTIMPLISLSQENISWGFPVKQGTEEWKKLKNNKQKVDACQIPEQLLSGLATADLIGICLNYPLLPDILAFNNITDGLKKFESDFNGFRELITRKDVMRELLKEYKKTDPATIPVNATILEKGNHVLRSSFIELFASHDLVAGKSSFNEKKEFVKELVIKKEKKKLHPQWYGTTGLQTNILAIVKIIQSESDGNKSRLNLPELSHYVHTGHTLTPEIRSLVDQEAYNFIKYQP